MNRQSSSAAKDSPHICGGQVSEKSMCEEKYCELNMYDADYVKNLVLVNFHMLGKYMFTQSYSYDTNVAQMKYELANKLRTAEEHLQIMHWHVFLNDCVTLEYIPTECQGFIDLTVVNVNSEREPGMEEMVVPDIITVRIQQADMYKDITVEIEDRRIRKPYIGGYRNKETGIEYHHAFTQTGPPPPKVLPRNKNTRDTQTLDTRNRRIHMSYSRSTQMCNEHTWMPNANDKIITAQKYETAEERAERIGYLRKVITIQRYFRRWKLNAALKKLVAEYRERIQNEKREQQELLRDYERQRKREIINKVFPRSRADFSMLYAMVDRWKKAHIERISKLYTPAAKLAEFCMLLNKEIEMLNVIEKHRQRLKQEMKVIKEIRFFDQISDAVTWKGYKGLQVSMDTLETQKGREFKQVYYTLCNQNLTIEERLQFIAELSFKLKQHNCVVGNELASLLDREMELLHRGVDNNQLDMLRKRTHALLLKHFQMPECNEGVTRRLDKLKGKSLEHNLIFCPRCLQFKSHKEYQLSYGSDKFRTCITCTWLDRTAEPWIDIAPYRLILRAVRKDEKKRNSLSSIAFIVQERDIHYLVERIWHAQSVVSECKILEKLRLVRWDVRNEWSPWNCILLTDDEAQSHLRIENLQEVYDEEFIRIIVGKHMFARCIFANVLLLERSIRKQENKVREDTETGDEEDMKEQASSTNEVSDLKYAMMDYLPGGRVFFFLEISRSLSGLAAGSDNVGARYFRPELLPMLSERGKEDGFLFLTLEFSFS